MSAIDGTRPPHTLVEAWRLLRPRQWVKNAFVLSPLIFTGAFADPRSVQLAVSAVVLFCLASSIGYVANDLRDVDRDRAHPEKRATRPLAAGTVSTRQASVMLGALIVVLVAWIAAWPVMAPVMAAYLASTLLYTLWLKDQPVLDLFVLAFGFVLRVHAGARALDVPVSAWMFVTTLCLALFLAAVKRRQELLHRGSGGRAVLRHYTVPLMTRYAEMASASALVFYSLFVLSAHQELVLTVPIVMFGIFRYWYTTERLQSGESPTDALFADPQLQVAVALWVVACVFAMAPARP
ncbi:decaprenyl-phosphate phosphoribosyltransferase [Luteitalea sp.]